MDSGHDTETNGDLRKDSSTSTTVEGVDSDTTEQQLNRRASSRSSSSSSSESSSENCFQLSENETPTSPLGSIVSQTDDEDSDSTSLKSEPNQAIQNIGDGNMSRKSCDSSTIPATISIEAEVSPPVSQCSSKVTFKITETEGEREDTQMAPKPDEIRVISRPTTQQRSHELARSPPKPGSNGSTTQFPPTQVMERPADSNSSGYRIPSYVFARTKSTAPMEWSTTSNESLFSIHMGNMSFNRDQLLWLGKSGELGKPGDLSMSGPLMDVSSYQPPLSNNSNRPAQIGQNSSQVNEAKAAETMREVIRESADNRDREDDASSPVKEGYPSSRISRHADDSTKSFAFPILTGESVSLKAGGGKQAQHSRRGTPKATPVAAGTPRANRLFDQQSKWLSCFSCFRPFCS
ncbi:hypothetical protein PanWU01x14_079130 [Parasponia andersonii]|uniref:Uncharacterized protein n=1 Tax=Parasponia andersonii TaxID=3476 RepID=A0A2P5DB79_PARAD|nr:hypothetical protein PanWU01x14_079130 [Parasponia andersonii]